MKRPNLSAAALTLAGAFFLAACGDSSDSGPAGTSRISTGAITAAGDGAITVNGVSYGTAGANVAVEGAPGSAAALAPGMIVTVKGRVDDRTGSATEIEYEDVVQGVVESKVGNVLSVGGQTVRVDDSTHFEDNVNRLGSIVEGERVEVSGVPDDKGGLRATRVDDSPGLEGFEIKGIVSNLSAPGVTPVTFDVKVSPAASETWSITLAGALPAGIQDGSYVEVHSAADPVGFAVGDATVKLEDRLGDRSGEGDEYEIEGIVTSGDATEFVVNGVTVRPLGNARWVYGVPADLVPGVKVEADGHGFDVDGALLAHKISFRAVVRLQFPATNLALTGDTGSMELFGLPVSVSDLTDWRVPPASVGEGAMVEVRGYPNFDGSGIVGTRVELSDDLRVYLQGVVTDKTATNLTILDRTVVTAFSQPGDPVTPSTGTEFQLHDQEANIGQAAFMAAVVPGTSVVRARGESVAAYDAGTLTAEEVEFEDD